MDPLAFMGLFMVGWELLRRRRGSILYDRLAALSPPKSIVSWCCGGLVILFCCQLALMIYRADHDMPRLWQTALPYYRLLDMGPYLRDPSDPVESGLALLVAILESACLLVAALGYAHFNDRAIATAFWSAVTSIAVIAIAAPILAEKDIFEYLQCGELGFDCYAPAGQPMPDSLRFVSEHVKLEGSLYGPLWVAANTLIARIPAQSLVARVEVLRVYSAAVVLGVAWLLRRIGAPKTVRAAFVLSPFIWTAFVTNAHIDMQAILPIVAAQYFVMRNILIWAAVLVGCAGLVKLPYVFLGGLLFIAWSSVGKRFAAWALAISVSLTGTYVAGHGSLYALQRFGNVGTLMSEKHYIIATALQIFTGVTLLFMVAKRRVLLGMLWVFPTGISPVGLPWYLAYAFPQGLVLGRTFTVFLGLSPISAVLLDQHDLYPVALMIASLVCGILAVDSRVSARRLKSNQYSESVPLR